MKRHVSFTELAAKEYPDARTKVQAMRNMDEETLDKMFASINRVDEPTTYASILRDVESGKHMCLDIACPKGKGPMEWLRELVVAEKNGTLWDLIERQNEMWKKGQFYENRKE